MGCWKKIVPCEGGNAREWAFIYKAFCDSKKKKKLQNKMCQFKMMFYMAFFGGWGIFFL